MLLFLMRLYRCKMKINKKIEIERHEMGVTFSNIKNELDSIEISEPIFGRINVWYNNIQNQNIKLNFIPFLKNGYIYIKDTDSVLFFSCSVKENGNIFIEFMKYLNCTSCDTINICGIEYSSIVWSYLLKTEIEKDCFFGSIVPTNFKKISENCEISSAAIVNAVDRGIQINANIIDSKYIKELDCASKDIYVFFVLMAYINFLLEYPEKKEINRKSQQTAKNQKKKNITDKVYKQRKSAECNILLNGVRFVTKDKKTQSLLKSKQSKKYVGSWYVSGHYRHYKSGKTVYIRPYKKGTGTETINRKIKHFVFKK